MRRLSRLLIIFVLLGIVAFAASRLMGGDDDDFDDFDDLDSGFDFEETPVEIDVPVTDVVSDSSSDASQNDNSSTSTSEPDTQSYPITLNTVRLDENTASTSDNRSSESDNGTSANGASDTRDTSESSDNGGNLIDIIGIGPAYEARLKAIGIESIRDLAGADAEDVATKVEVIGGAATIGDWISQAKSHGNPS